jgi:ABC-type multidrug transport system ATPase subunit
MDIIQKNLGLCQQFDVLFDLLTVREHLTLVCEIKNVPAAEVARTVNESMEIVMLTEFADKIAKNLSGGMKRKLSLAMAIVSKPKLIILDEPTSGLDIESRK